MVRSQVKLLGDHQVLERARENRENRERPVEREWQREIEWAKREMEREGHRNDLAGKSTGECPG